MSSAAPASNPTQMKTTKVTAATMSRATDLGEGDLWFVILRMVSLSQLICAKSAIQVVDSGAADKFVVTVLPE